MGSTPASAPPGASGAGDREVPLLRLYVMRAGALVLVVTGFLNYLPGLIHPSLTDRGMIAGMLAGLWAMSFLTLRYPLKMVPLFLFEFVWKTIWLARFGLPQWLAGVRSPRLSRDLLEIGLFPLVLALVIPWGYVWRRYVREPSERWR
jgi:hypothetical protein